MSTRTIVELNHDYIDKMVEDGHISREFYHQLMAYHHRQTVKFIGGLRILGTRHHSETLKLIVD